MKLADYERLHDEIRLQGEIAKEKKRLLDLLNAQEALALARRGWWRRWALLLGYIAFCAAVLGEAWYLAMAN